MLPVNNWRVTIEGFHALNTVRSSTLKGGDSPHSILDIYAEAGATNWSQHPQQGSTTSPDIIARSSSKCSRQLHTQNVPTFARHIQIPLRSSPSPTSAGVARIPRLDASKHFILAPPLRLSSDIFLLARGRHPSHQFPDPNTAQRATISGIAPMQLSFRVKGQSGGWPCPT